MAGFIEKRLSGPYGREWFEKQNPEDINKNAWGTLVYVEEDGKENPVICGHGGSMWLCIGCKVQALANLNK